jgi:hypothetical protein
MIVLWPRSSGLIDSDSGTGTGACVPPTEPTIEVNSAGTVVSITGSLAGTTNTVSYSSFSAGYGSYTWTDAGSRSGDGDVTITPALDPGVYWIRVVSENADGSAVSNLVKIRVGNPSGTLLHSPADILRRLMVQDGKGVLPTSATNTNWPISTSQELNAPDNTVTTYDTDGRDFGRSQPTSERFEHHGVMVRVRGMTFQEAWVKARALAVYLDEDVYQELVTVSGSTYLVHAVSRQSRPAYLGREPGTERHLFSINVTVNLHLMTT